MSNEITVDFETGEIVEDEHMKYIDYVFDNMNKADAKEAMKELVNSAKETIKSYEDSIKEVYSAYMDIYHFLETLGLLKY